MARPSRIRILDLQTESRCWCIMYGELGKFTRDQMPFHLSFACCKWKWSSCSAQVLKCSASFSLCSISSSVSLMAFSRSLSRRSCFTCTRKLFRIHSKILYHEIFYQFDACLLQFSAVLFLNLFVSFFKFFFSKMANPFLIQCLKKNKKANKLQYSSREIFPHLIQYKVKQ